MVRTPTPTGVTQEQKQAFQTGFRNHNWAPGEQSGTKINSIVKNPPELFAILRPLCSTKSGGTQRDNSKLHYHYKAQGCEYITAWTKESGIRWKDRGAEGAAFASNEGVAAGRGSRSEHPDTEDDDEDMSGAASRAAAAAPGTPAGASTGDTKPSGSPSDVMAGITAKLQSLMVHDDATLEQGWCFDGALPYIYWSYHHNGIRYLKYNFLVWTNKVDHFDPQVSRDGKKLSFFHRIPARFIGTARIRKQYSSGDAAAPSWADGNAEEIGEVMYQNADKLMQKIRDKFELQPIKPFMKIDLPFQCLQVFHDPYKPNTTGKSIGNYPIGGGDATKRFFCLHLSLRAADLARQNQETSYEEYDDTHWDD